MLDFHNRVYHTFANAGCAVSLLRFRYYSVRHDLFLFLMADQWLEKKNYNLARLLNGL